MFARSVWLCAPKLLSCAVTEEVVSSASTASGKLTPHITTVTMRLRRNGPDVSYDLQLIRDKASGKLYLNQIPDYVASHSVCLSTFFPLEGHRAPSKALCVAVANGEALQALSDRELQNFFNNGNDLSVQLVVEPKAYRSYRAMASVSTRTDASDDDDVSHRRVAHKKMKSHKASAKKATALSRRVAEDEEEDTYDAAEEEEEGEEENELEHVKRHKKDAQKGKARNKVKSLATSHRKKSPVKGKDKKRKPHGGKRSTDYEDDGEEDDVADEEGEDVPRKRQKVRSQKAKTHNGHMKKSNKKKPAQSRAVDIDEAMDDEASEEEEEAADEDALIDATVRAAKRSLTATSSAVDGDGDDEEYAWFRPSDKTSRTSSSTERATIQF